jgi:hypothetical protein
MAAYTIIAPSLAETSLTGFVGAMEKTWRGKLYRAESWRSGWRLLKDGETVRRWDDLPLPVMKAVKSYIAFLKSARELA